MATRATVAVYNRQMQTFEYMQRQILAEIDHRSKCKGAEENIMEKHHVDTDENGNRCWRF